MVAVIETRIETPSSNLKVFTNENLAMAYMEQEAERRCRDMRTEYGSDVCDIYLERHDTDIALIYHDDYVRTWTLMKDIKLLDSLPA